MLYSQGMAWTDGIGLCGVGLYVNNLGVICEIQQALLAFEARAPDPLSTVALRVQLGSDGKGLNLVPNFSSFEVNCPRLLIFASTVARFGK